MDLQVSTVIFGIVICMLQCSIYADIIVQPGYGQPSTNQLSSYYNPVAYQQPTYLRNADYKPTSQQPLPIQPDQYYGHPELDSEYQHYKELNQAVLQQLKGVLNDRNQMNSGDPNLGAPLATTSQFARPIVSNSLHNGNIYEVIPRASDSFNAQKFGGSSGHLLGSPQPQTYYLGSPIDVGHTQWARSVQPKGANTGNVDTTISEIQDGHDVATQSAVAATGIPELESLKESEDTKLESRATRHFNAGMVGSPLDSSYKPTLTTAKDHLKDTTGLNTDRPSNSSANAEPSLSHILDKIRSTFSSGETHNKEGSGVDGKYEKLKGKAGKAIDYVAQANPNAQSPSGQNSIADTYRNHYNQAKSYLEKNPPVNQGHVPADRNGYTGYSGYPAASPINSNGGYGPYNQASYGPSPYRQNSADFVNKERNYQFSDWARQPKQWAQDGLSALNNYINPASYRQVNNNPSVLPSSGAPSNIQNAYRTAANFVNKGLTYQPSDWARYGKQWARDGVAAFNNYVNPTSYRQARDIPVYFVPQDSQGALRTTGNFVNKGLTYNGNNWARYGDEWGKDAVSALDNYVNPAPYRQVNSNFPSQISSNPQSSFINRGLNYQPNDLNRFAGNQWTNGRNYAVNNYANPVIYREPNASPYNVVLSGTPNNPSVLNYQPSNSAPYGNQWTSDGISTFDRQVDNTYYVVPENNFF